MCVCGGGGSNEVFTTQSILAGSRTGLFLDLGQKERLKRNTILVHQIGTGWAGLKLGGKVACPTHMKPGFEPQHRKKKPTAHVYFKNIF